MTVPPDFLRCEPWPRPRAAWERFSADADISRESLYRALSPKGNPTLKTLLAVLKAVQSDHSDASSSPRLRLLSVV